MQAAIRDIVDGFRMWRVWTALAKEEIGDQHRKTALGPLWLLVTYLAFACTFIFVFDRGHGAKDYPAYVATGLLVWTYIMDVLSNSIMLFSREESFVKGTRLPYSVYVFRLVLQCVIRGGYALLGCLIILNFSSAPVSVCWLWSLIGFLIIILVSFPSILLMSIIGVFFPDSQFIVKNMMRIGMFLTPVFWSPLQSDGVRSLLYIWNPFTYFLEIVRQPVVEGMVPWIPFLFCLISCAVVWLSALFIFERTRNKIVFVL